MSQKIDALLTPKQQKFIRSEDKRINILSGSVRSGKTYVSLIKFALFVAQSNKKDEFLMCGVTLTTLKRNCLDLLMDLVGANNFRYSITAKEGRLFGRRIFLEGDSDSSREGNIRGATLKGAYVDEVTLCNEDFFKMLLSRLSVANAKLYATCNPDTPIHYIKSDYIDRVQDLNLRVWDFYLEDNTFLPEDYIKDLKTEYTGVFYDRYILGKWVKAEGLIYPMYEEAKGEVEFRTKTNGEKDKFTDYGMSIDYGTQNAFACLLWGKYDDVWYAFRGYYYSGRREGHQKTDEDYADDLDLLVEDIELQYGQKMEVIIDPSAASMKATLKKRKYKVRDADNAVEDGLRETATALQKGLVKISPDIEDFWKEISGYVWDDNEEREQPIKVDDHFMDALRYWVKTKKIVKKRRQLDD